MVGQPWDVDWEKLKRKGHKNDDDKQDSITTNISILLVYQHLLNCRRPDILGMGLALWLGQLDYRHDRNTPDNPHRRRRQDIL